MNILSAKSYEFELITPLIMTGAKKDKIEFRTQSIIGILRWWFRFYKACEVENLGELKKIEDKIWGSQEKAKEFWLKIEKYPREERDYYAYLRMNDKTRDKIKRPAFKPENNTFSLSFKYLGNFDSQGEIEKTLKFLSTFGGLGARWRRGFSSVIWNEVVLSGSNLDEIIDKIKKILELNTSKPDSADDGLDEFMNLKNTSIYLVKPENKFWDNWKNGINSLREEFYRPLKKYLELREIKLSRTSPLIIQIKKSGDNNYFGVLLLWKLWKRFSECEDFIENCSRKRLFEIKRIKT